MSLKNNIIANFLGGGWSALMGIIFIPAYMRLMGVEAYGIVGVFLSLQAVIAVLDLGLSQALGREMARIEAETADAAEMADTVRTLEIVYWCVALAIAAFMVLIADFLAYRWLNPEQLSRESLLHALWIMAAVVAFRWPVALYTGGLNGLQRQVPLNAAQMIFSTIQGGGAVIVLWVIEPSVHIFFFWQAAVSLFQVFALRVMLWRSLHVEGKGVFSNAILKRIWRFAAGMSGISIATMILTQMDKVVLSKILSLNDFGYYTFATTVAALVYRLISPLYTAYYPRLTGLVARQDKTKLVNAYHQGCQLMTVAVFPAAVTLAVYSREILTLWVGDPGIVANSHLLVSLVVVGNALNGLIHLPYALQQAHGWTRLMFFSSIIAMGVLAPAIYFSALWWGAAGAAAVWILVNIGHVLISVQLMHNRLLSDEKWRWYWQDVFLPIAVAFIVTATLRVIELALALEKPAVIAAYIVLSGVSALFAALVVVPSGRAILRCRFKS